MITINDYMNLSAITGTRILSTKNIVHVLNDNYNQLRNKIKLIYVGDASGYDEGNWRRVILYIPSESCKDLFYTVVIDFLIGDKKEITGSTKMKIFSNSPNFQFTYGYVYNKAQMLVEDYKKYLDPKTFTRRPKQRNPKELIGIEKSIAYAIFWIKDNLKYKITYDKGAEPRKIHSTQMIVDQNAHLKKQGKCESKSDDKFKF